MLAAAVPRLAAVYKVKPKLPYRTVKATIKLLGTILAHDSRGKLTLFIEKLWLFHQISPSMSD